MKLFFIQPMTSSFIDQRCLQELTISWSDDKEKSKQENEEDHLQCGIWAEPIDMK